MMVLMEILDEHKTNLYLTSFKSKCGFIKINGTSNYDKPLYLMTSFHQIFIYALNKLTKLMQKYRFPIS
jgi:hypothetical protein